MKDAEAGFAWHDEAELLGVRARAWFFEPDVAHSSSDPVVRLLPLLAGVPVTPLSDAGARPTYQLGVLQAQPEMVLGHGDGPGSGLLCLGNRPVDGRRQLPQMWQRQLPVDTVLQALATAMAVSGQCQQPAVALWRGPNVVWQFDPGPQVLECLAHSIGAAWHYWGRPAAITPAQLAAFCEPRLRAMPGLAQPVPADAGLAPG